MSTGPQQLATDFEEIKKLLESYPNIKILETQGDPPERYDIEYTVKGYKTGLDGSPVPAATGGRDVSHHVSHARNVQCVLSPSAEALFCVNLLRSFRKNRVDMLNNSNRAKGFCHIFIGLDLLSFLLVQLHPSSRQNNDVHILQIRVIF